MATYGDLNRDISSPDCKACPTSSQGYFYTDPNNVDVSFTPSPVAKIGADGPGDCLSNYQQIEGNGWYLGNAADPTATASFGPKQGALDSFQDCVTNCGSGCMYATFLYQAQSGNRCYHKMVTQPAANT